MLKPPIATHRRTHSDIQERTVNTEVTLSLPGQGSDGQLDLDRAALGSPHIEKKRGGGYVVRRQMKQVVGDLVTVLGELKTVVGDIRTLVTQIDVVTHKLDQSVSSDQSDKSTGSYDLLKAVSRSRSRSRSSGSCTADQSDSSQRHSSSQENELGNNIVSRRMSNMCDLSCFHSKKEDGRSHKSLNSHETRSRSSGSSNTAMLVDRQGERLSNHDTVYVAYRPRSNYLSSNQRPLSTPNKTVNPLMRAANVSENCLKPKRTQSKSNPYIAHIYENIKAFTRKNTTDGKITVPCNKTQDRFTNIPKRAQKNHYISISTQQSKQTNGTREKTKAPANSKHKMKSPHKSKKKTPAEYSGMYEKEMEERLELEFDESLDLLDTLAEIQTVDNEFDQGFEDCDLVQVRDPYPIDMVRKHADVVAWAQSAWPEARLLGNSLDYSDNTDEETDSEWYEAPPAVPKSTNPYLADFRWRTVIEP